ncbi:gamma-glutamylcyclotransferase [Hazenella sp. IB182357]|uniref:Gamma-glutamylcyclotransferase n=1 Tax=Polycladospora coralii TaxID=2771432 RepID=A0A926RT88_9BACL|nr:gamma-glutamylcyclotransferase family protein [Polycladospora coralii]MBD1371027.1 gamma-glutamylcyclotransferase [Polycladospora coralii]
MLYFAYGSCMDEKSFAETVGMNHFTTLGRAVLSDYTLVFNWCSQKSGTGVADIIPKPDEWMEGVLYQLDDLALPPLDRREGVHEGIYYRKRIQVKYNHQDLKVMTYSVVNKSDQEIKPSVSYLQKIYNGTKKHLSPIYLQKLVEKWEKQFGISSFRG